MMAVLLCAGCAAQPPLAKPGVTPAQYNEDRLHCQAQMYSQRLGVGRSAPNWNWFEQCMRSRGYERR